jgi:isocitrate/isopropylmalate dehydrogenase
MKSYSIAAIPGDVIGTEVIAAGIGGRRNASSNMERTLGRSCTTSSVKHRDDLTAVFVYESF